MTLLIIQSTSAFWQIESCAFQEGQSILGFVMGRKLPKEDYSFLLEELIGLNLKIKRASSKDLQGMEGRIIDEGKNSFLLETSKGRKRIPKIGTTFVFESHHEVEGNLLLIRPEDRTKKLAKEIG